MRKLFSFLLALMLAASCCMCPLALAEQTEDQAENPEADQAGDYTAVLFTSDKFSELKEQCSTSEGCAIVTWFAILELVSNADYTADDVDLSKDSYAGTYYSDTLIVCLLPTETEGVYYNMSFASDGSYSVMKNDSITESWITETFPDIQQNSASDLQSVGEAITEILSEGEE